MNENMITMFVRREMGTVSDGGRNAGSGTNQLRAWVLLYRHWLGG